MHDTELFTFIQKFNQLWNDGLDAHLDLESHDGQAWVGLRVKLGNRPGPLHHQLHPHHQQNKTKQNHLDSVAEQGVLLQDKSKLKMLAAKKLLKVL